MNYIDRKRCYNLVMTSIASMSVFVIGICIIEYLDRQYLVGQIAYQKPWVNWSLFEDLFSNAVLMRKIDNSLLFTISAVTWLAIAVGVIAVIWKKVSVKAATLLAVIAPLIFMTMAPPVISARLFMTLSVGENYSDTSHHIKENRTSRDNSRIVIPSFGELPSIQDQLSIEVKRKLSFKSEAVGLIYKSASLGMLIVIFAVYAMFPLVLLIAWDSVFGRKSKETEV